MLELILVPLMLSVVRLLIVHEAVQGVQFDEKTNGKVKIQICQVASLVWEPSDVNFPRPRRSHSPRFTRM